jgi:ribosomal protein S18 acetylase RimI-like enzyme
MISIAAARNAPDFSAVAVLCRALGEWDAREAPNYGVPPELVLELYHSDDEADIVTKYSTADALIYLARWEGQPAGCIAVSPFDDSTLEVEKFYVDAVFRGKGIGRALMAALLDDAERSNGSRILIHTAAYMKNAVSLYRSFGFAECPPFRDVPASVIHSEIFMSRAL